MNKTKRIWLDLIAPNIVKKYDDGELIGFHCPKFFFMTDEEFETYLEAHVYEEE
jgi:hypothetical protein